jgi:uncharacterized flavoprotein (TIGR03862 family)
LAGTSQVAIVGAGPAGLMAAEVVAQAGIGVTIYDRMPSAARKFLLAGRGGLNLTHSEDFERLLARYGEAAPRLRPALEALPPAALRAWSEGLGQPTFIGSSGRVFPAALKASPLLRAWLRRLEAAGVRFAPRHHWQGWDDGALVLDGPDGRMVLRPAATVLALGGASWPRLGSDGGWADALARAGVSVAPLRPANSGFLAPWTALFRDRFEGAPLKRIALSFGGVTVRGEAVVTRTGLEGGAVYALSAGLREAVAASGEAVLSIALRPDDDIAGLERKLAMPRGKQSFSTFLRKTVHLPPVAIGLLQEVAAASDTRLAALRPAALAQLINAVPVRLTGTAAIERAISTAGGVALDALDDDFMLRPMPGTFVAGEMLDWEAPTGGYLLQACFATGAAAGRGAVKWVENNA